MNKVYLSGIVAQSPIQIGSQESPAHAVFRLEVSHQNSKGEWRRELYGINSWNAAAQWVLANLQQGQRVALVGYLTQRTVRAGDSASVLVEVTSQEFLPLAFKARGTRSGAAKAEAPHPAARAPGEAEEDDLLPFEDMPDEPIAS